MSKRSYYVTVGLVFLVVVALLNLPDRVTAQIRLVIGALYLPLFGLAGSVTNAGDQAQGLVASRRRLWQQVESLRRENEELRFQVSQLEEAWRENARLRHAMDWQSRSPWRLRGARIIGQDPANWWLGVHIDVGSRNQIRPELPALTANGLVGKVAEVGYARSRVVLIGDPGCRVAAQVRETREKGLVIPSLSSLDRSQVTLAYLPVGSEIQPGHLIITSGDGGVFPKGIPIGKVTEIKTNTLGLYLEARVRLGEQANRLEELWIMSL